MDYFPVKIVTTRKLCTIKIKNSAIFTKKDGGKIILESSDSRTNISISDKVVEIDKNSDDQLFIAELELYIKTDKRLC